MTVIRPIKFAHCSLSFRFPGWIGNLSHSSGTLLMSAVRPTGLFRATFYGIFSVINLKELLCRCLMRQHVTLSFFAMHHFHVALSCNTSMQHFNATLPCNSTCGLTDVFLSFMGQLKIIYGFRHS